MKEEIRLVQDTSSSLLSNDSPPSEETLLSMFELVESLQILRVLDRTRSDRMLLICDVVPKYSDGPHGLHVIEIAPQERGRRLHQRLREVQGILPAKALPELIEYKETGNLSGLLYSISNPGLLKSDLLSVIIRKEQLDLDLVHSYISAVSELLLDWNSLFFVEQTRTSASIPQLLSAMLHDATKQTLRSETGGLMSLVKPKSASLLVEGIAGTLPNPLAYLANEGLWTERSGIIPTIIRFASRGHGNLISANVLVHPTHKTSSPERADTVHLLDLSSFDPVGPLFTDQTRLEQDIILGALPISGLSDISDWMYLAQHLSSGVFPDGRPKGVKSPLVWELIRPLRATARHYRDNATEGLQDYYDISFWLASLATSLQTVSQGFLNMAEQAMMLTLGALALRNILELLDLPLANQAPDYISWDSLQFKKPGVSAESASYQAFDKASELAHKIVDLLRSNEKITISGTLGLDRTSGLPRSLVIFRRENAVELTIDQSQAINLVRSRPADIDQYLASLLIQQDVGPWDSRYVPLEGEAQQAVVPEYWSGYVPNQFLTLHRRGEGPNQRFERVPIEDIATAVDRYQQFVILGDPGAGKTTVLHKLTLDFARARIITPSAPIPLFVRLSQYRPNVSPYDFLKSIWERRLGGVEGAPSFTDALHSSQIVLLLDGLNEMNRSDYATQVADWRLFISEYDWVRMVFTCRTLDYSLPLQIQHIEIQNLDNNRVKEFLYKYLGTAGERLWVQLENSTLLDLARNPFILAMLSWIQAQSEENLPASRGALLNSFTAGLLRREELQGHPDWIESSALSKAIGVFAWELQRKGEGTSIPVRTALQDLIPATVSVRGHLIQTPPATVLRLGQSSNILRETLDGQVSFYHHLLQEHFAGWELVYRLDSNDLPAAELWAVPWLESRMPSPENHGEWEPLPPPPSTGWEETTIVAAGILKDATPLVGHVRLKNPILAARCISEAKASVSTETEVLIKNDLLDMMSDPEVHLRARISAGRTLSVIGDPRFVVHSNSDSSYIEPPLVRVASGIYLLGAKNDSQASANEFPQHEFVTQDFMMGKYLVTVGEYQHFVKAGGYDDERWWRSRMAKAWLKGDEIEGGAIDGMLKNRQKLLDSDKPLKYWQEHFGWRPKTLDFWARLISISAEEARQELRDIYHGRTRREPLYWNDPDYHVYNKPVVGITWLEAQAYCAWLRTVSGRDYRLPSEAEWEIAATGGINMRYPWGDDFANPLNSNTVEGKVLRTTTVGVYPNDVSRFGVTDVVGNVREWTLSLYATYPYDPKDGREDDKAPGERVMRSGAWSRSASVARCTFRDHFGVDFCDYNIGFRICCHIQE